MVPLMRPWWTEMDIIVLGTVGCASVVFLLSAIIICYKAIKRLDVTFLLSLGIVLVVFHFDLTLTYVWNILKWWQIETGTVAARLLSISCVIWPVGGWIISPALVCEWRGRLRWPCHYPAGSHWGQRLDNGMGCKCQRGRSTTLSHPEASYILNLCIGVRDDLTLRYCVDFNLRKCLKPPGMAAGFMKVKARAEQRNPKTLLLQRELFPPFGLLEKRLREFLACSTTQTQFSVWHSGSTVSHMHSDIHVNVRRHLTNTHTRVRIVQSAACAQGGMQSILVCTHPWTHNILTYKDTSSWRIYTHYKLWHKHWLSMWEQPQMCVLN